MLIALFIVLVLLCGATLALLFRIVRSGNKRLLMAGTHRASGDAPDGVGISVLCSGVRAPEQIENLLSVEYGSYEVVMVLDSQRYPVEFAAIVARYRMIRVEYLLSAELSVPGVRALVRSRKRCFRRLVLVDKAQTTPEEDFDAAVGVATYDYVLPVREGQYLLRDAVERLVAEAGEQGTGAYELISTRIGETARLLHRETVVGAGGFAFSPWTTVSRVRRKTIWEPVFCSPRPIWHSCMKMKWMLVMLLAVAIVAAAWMQWWWVAAMLLTGALVWSAVVRMEQVFGDIASVCGTDGFSWRGYRRKISVKNFTMS